VIERPLIGMVSRFAGQKGFDLMESVGAELAKEEMSLVALGAGEPRYERFFRELAASHPDRIGVRIAYDEALAHKIEAGADMFLMPSKYEPCGLNQIYSLKYGTAPVVRATGGLDDTIEDYDPVAGTGNGFKFTDYSASALLAAVRRAAGVYGDKKRWRQVVANGMASDFSWEKPAEEYMALYRSLAQT
jgi:starch synthase